MDQTKTQMENRFHESQNPFYAQNQLQNSELQIIDLKNELSSKNNEIEVLKRDLAQKNAEIQKSLKLAEAMGKRNRNSEDFGEIADEAKSQKSSSSKPKI